MFGLTWGEGRRGWALHSMPLSMESSAMGLMPLGCSNEKPEELVEPCLHIVLESGGHAHRLPPGEAHPPGRSPALGDGVPAQAHRQGFRVKQQPFQKRGRNLRSGQPAHASRPKVDTATSQNPESGDRKP